jgi:hypothetical protein
MGLAAAAIALVLYGGRTWRIAAKALLLTGFACLAVAAGRPTFDQTGGGTIAVMVDLSPSTRGATFRDASALQRRIQQLLGNRPYQLLGFSDRNEPIDLTAPLRELACDETRFVPPPVDAVVLFSDGRFDLPSFAPPTYPVIDPALDQPGDRAVSRLQIFGDRVGATLSNEAGPIRWTGATPGASSRKGTIQFAAPSGKGEITANIPTADLWPENDSLSIIPPPPLTRQRWWIGDGCPPGWVAKSQLPSDMAEYLSVAAVVLRNIPTDALSSQLQLRLGQYVKELGGSLVIVGGDHAFAAGGYGGTALEDLSPLASNPPRPVMRWLIVADSSGSMAGDAWATECAVIRNLLPKLPANDYASVGDFARDLRWWWHDAAASDAARRELPVINPNGPTNLAAMLRQLASQADGITPEEMLLLTDADAELPDADSIAAEFSRKKIAFNLLALGNGSALPALRAIASKTGGTVLQQADSSQWVAAANQLLRSALPGRYEHQAVDLIPGPGRVTEWNRTWARPEAQVIQHAGETPMVARWKAGAGQVAAIAYPVDSVSIEALAGQIAQPPVDPRFEVEWDAGEKLSVAVSASDRGQYLNGEAFSIELREADSLAVARSAAVPQTAPGQYGIVLPAPRTSMLVILRHGDQAIRQFAVAGRYAPEFDWIGNDRPNLAELARRTGGRVIPPGLVAPLDTAGSKRLMDLTSAFAIAGFAAISGGLVANRKR